MKWFKFYGQDYLSDPKILALSASERSCWITLLSYGSVNDNGLITFLNEEQLMAQSGISPIHEEWDQTVGVLKKLENLKMITACNGMITIVNWRKRQEISLTGYERIKRYREKKRADNANDNAMITIEENRIDKNRIYTASPKGEKSHLEVKELFDYYAAEFGQKVTSETKPIFNWGQCEKLAKPLIKKIGLERMKKLIDAYLVKDAFYEKNGWGLQVFLSGTIIHALNAKTK